VGKFQKNKLQIPAAPKNIMERLGFACLPVGRGFKIWNFYSLYKQQTAAFPV
jgi:hypothetical protein